jgi:orotidine-5'-phosphate decarboxylase
VKRLVVALDVAAAEEAVRLARAVAPHVAGLQVGLEILHGPGPAVVGAVARLAPVLVDASLLGSLSSVAASARRLGEYGARWVTVHALGGTAMLEAAAEGLREGARGRPAGILAITVLPNGDAAALAAAGFPGSRGKMVARLTKMAASAGVEGVVCPATELGVVAGLAPGVLKVSPVSRDAEPDVPAEARQAVRGGADLVVVGRPVLAAAEPADAAAGLEALLGGR